MAYFMQIAFAGIALGCIYALIGLGFSIIFKASEVINFAQGELLLVGAYVVSSAVFAWHLNFIVAVLAGVAVTVVEGDRLILAKGDGYSNIETKAPIDPERTLFRIASITKVVTTLKMIEAKVAHIVTTFGVEADPRERPETTSAARAELLNGPQLPDQAMDQSDIDKLMASFE